MQRVNNFEVDSLRPALMQNKTGGVQTREDRRREIGTEFAVSEMCFAHTWHRGRMNTRSSSYTLRREQVREGGTRLERGRCSGSPQSANTLGRLRIMMPYCIQIRIPTVRCAPRYMGIDMEIALYRGNTPPARHKR